MYTGNGYCPMDKYAKLKDILKGMGSVLIAYSGGVDSTFLLKASSEELKDNTVAVTAESPVRQKKEIARAKKMAGKFGVKHIVFTSGELEDENVRNNAKDRCYFCKKGLFLKLREIADVNGIKYIADGSNIDDLKCYRPGKRALEELNVRSPLIEAGLSKNEIREFSREAGLETWNIPTESCYLTRFPYGTEIKTENIRKVELAEDFIINFGFKEVRVRSYDGLTRIEVAPGEVRKMCEKTLSIIRRYLENLGFTNILIDKEGYRSGSMDEE